MVMSGSRQVCDHACRAGSVGIHRGTCFCFLVPLRSPSERCVEISTPHFAFSVRSWADATCVPSGANAAKVARPQSETFRSALGGGTACALSFRARQSASNCPLSMQGRSDNRTCQSRSSDSGLGPVGLRGTIGSFGTCERAAEIQPSRQQVRGPAPLVPAHTGVILPEFLSLS
ncbi:hypothetical protein OH76DRAFT_273309 [Lentinus brumalis]|uniref:Uncharacterized protein n=1 Tax=Lentinus brumalis TaxID=2498619 RepID=A0A371DGY0_9APHY|nr:hypothetical protein OH76DRAFT_273309 [Polyporus brumalis]